MNMFRVLVLGLLLTGYGAVAQVRPAIAVPASIESNTLPNSPASESSSSSTDDADLPDAPGAVKQQENVVVLDKQAQYAKGEDRRSCNFLAAIGPIYFDPAKVDEHRPRCAELVYPYQRFLDTNIPVPLSWKQKGLLAAHYSTDPASLGTIIGTSAISIAADSHTAYGPGFRGFGGLVGVSLLQNTTAEVFGTFAVPALTHQDPRYYRMPNKPLGKRILYSITRSYISRSDTGKPMPNYGVFAAYPFVAEIGNLYVPGIESDGESTAKRILTGYALDPVNNLVNEFLPDVAKRIHVRIIFVQQILNNIAVSGSGVM